MLRKLVLAMFAALLLCLITATGGCTADTENPTQASTELNNLPQRNHDHGPRSRLVSKTCSGK